MEYGSSSSSAHKRDALCALAMRVINSYSYVDYLSDLLALRVTRGNPEAAYAIYKGLRGDGQKSAATRALVAKYLSGEDQKILKRLRRRMEEAEVPRNLLAHGLWYFAREHPELLIVVDARLLRDDVYLIQSGSPPPAVVDGGLAPALLDAVVIADGELREWVELNRQLERWWGRFLMIAQGGLNATAADELRTRLRREMDV